VGQTESFQQEERMPLSSETARVIGKKGGATTLARYGTAHMQALGKKGWAVMVGRHGRAALVANGKKGFQVTADRYFGGDRKALIQWLIDAGLAVIDPMPQNGVWQRRQPWPARTDATASAQEDLQ
jgi:hypothetical protein